MTVRAQPVMSHGHSARVARAMVLSDSAIRKRYRSSYETSSSLSSPALRARKRYRGTSKLILGTDSEEDEIRWEDGDEDEGHGLDDEDRSIESDGLGLEGEKEAVPEGHQQAALVVETAVGEPLGLGYKALRRRELAIKEDQVYNTFEVGQGSGSIPEPERPERVSALRQPTLTTWIDLEDGIAYIDIPTYPPPAPFAQTSPSPEWSSGSLPVSPTPSAVPSPISSPMISLTVPSPTLTTTIQDHTQRLDVMPPTLFAGIDRDVRELYTRPGVVRVEIFSHRPVLALEAWAGHVDTRMADMSWAGYDDHRLVHDMLVQQAALQRELQEMRGRVTA
ncbi:hypothetical protein Tco_1088047 [Tanacetum coccineum]